MKKYILEWIGYAIALISITLTLLQATSLLGIIAGIVAIVSVVVSVYQKKYSDRKNQEEKKELEQANRSRDEFAYNTWFNNLTYVQQCAVENRIRMTEKQQ